MHIFRPNRELLIPGKDSSGPHGSEGSSIPSDAGSTVLAGLASNLDQQR